MGKIIDAIKSKTDFIKELGTNAVRPDNFTINSRTAKIADVQKTFMWQLYIPGISYVAGKSTGALLDLEDMLIRCRSISIPRRETEAIRSHFMGTSQYFPGKTDAGGTVSVSFEETEDLTIARTFYSWNQAIFNIDPDAGSEAGKSAAFMKSSLVKDVYLILLGYGGQPLGCVKYNNAWVQNIGESQLSYEDGGAVKYDVTFQYDYWTLISVNSIL